MTRIMELAHKKINGSQMAVHRLVEISRAARDAGILNAAVKSVIYDQAKWNEARDLQLADRPRFHNLFATRLDPPCSAQHLLRPPSPQSFIFQNFGTRLQKRNRRPVRNACWHRAPGLRNGDENMRNNRVGDYVLRQHCAKDREKGSPAMQSILVRFDVASFACEFVTCYEFRARHINVMPPRNIVIGDAYTSVSCRLLVLRRRIIRITALISSNDSPYGRSREQVLHASCVTVGLKGKILPRGCAFALAGPSRAVNGRQKDRGRTFIRHKSNYARNTAIQDKAHKREGGCEFFAHHLDIIHRYKLYIRKYVHEINKLAERRINIQDFITRKSYTDLWLVSYEEDVALSSEHGWVETYTSTLKNRKNRDPSWNQRIRSVPLFRKERPSPSPPVLLPIVTGHEFLHREKCILYSTSRMKQTPQQSGPHQMQSASLNILAE
ncbi:hypothetical protein EAG_15978 [Camponotus floridanus]|uniref:Uncharacterized protein n=1 Tax=Camponotus floridanus TaxID=104421 RepID=E2A334_CAMFO|nr:hypothetical protein EAG_15978 [Camponotus floridanus]